MIAEVDFQSRHKRRSGRRFAERPIVFLFETVICIGILAAAGYGIHRFLYRSEDFLVKTISVEGANELRPAEIVRAAGITTADSIMQIDVGAVESRVRALPSIKSCKVTRRFPDTVAITVTERSAIATLMVNNHVFEIDPDGTVLRELISSAVHEGPYISNVPNLDVVEVGQRLTEPALTAALEVWMAFSNTTIGHEVKVSELSASSPNDIRMYVDELPFEIRWGRGDFVSEAARLNALWESKNKRIGCAEYLDLRFGEDLACK